MHVFAKTGFHATPVTDVATAAGVSPAYVFRLFDGKIGLFVAAVENTYARVAETMEHAGSHSSSSDPQSRLAAMTMAYVALIEDEDLIMLQAHAQSASSVPEIRAAVQRGLGEVVRTVSVVSGATPDAVQRFIAYGQLCHLIVQADLSSIRSSWAESITAGIKHTA
ncbi:TetR/AcrR family transcriptional regulator [Brevibacterium picturae]|uniref:TetR/AcrR family transcriptional regulator n=1 Tax=Brevibacterium picturae TaxID=260553 RepID=A0ABN2CS40_9MICO